MSGNQPKRVMSPAVSSQAVRDFRFPPLSNTAVEVLTMMSDREKRDIKKLAKIISADPATSTMILRRVNSPYVGLRTKVVDIPRAVSLLGFRDVANLVLAAGLSGSASKYLSSPIQCKLYEYIMEFSTVVAGFADAVAHELAIPYKETAFSAGLMHQLGRIVLLHNHPDAYIPLWWPKEGNPETDLPMAPNTRTEQAFFGIDSIYLGSTMAHTWGFPEELMLSILHQEEPDHAPGATMRMLTYAVVVGVEAATSLFRERQQGLMPAPSPSTSVAAGRLAVLRRRDAEDVVAFLYSQREKVQSLAGLLSGSSGNADAKAA